MTKNYVYFVVSSDHDFIKIGETSQPYKRFKLLCKENRPFDIYMIVLKGTSLVEKKLHMRFAWCHKLREWFTGNPELYAFIQTAYEDRRLKARGYGP